MGMEEKRVNEMPERWLQGEEVDWNAIYDGTHIPGRINLPCQPLEENEMPGKSEYQEKTAEREEDSKTDAAVYSGSLTDTVMLSVCNILHMKEMETNKAFAEYGLDSVKGAELVADLNAELQIDLSPTDLYNYTTVEQLTDYIHSNYNIQPVLPQNENCAPDKGITSMAKQPIAIIGVSGRFAGSEQIKDLWQHLENGDDLVETIYKWPMEGHGSFIAHIDEFDPLFFNISGLEAVYMDPQQRLFLEESFKALEDAGYAGKSIEGSKCGVFVGSTGGDYKDLFEGDIPAQALWGNMNAMIPTRISYFLNLKGPAINVDTACSSSLVAVHTACQSIWSKESDMAIAGGVFLQCTPKMFSSGNKGGMLSATGACHTFDESADGFVPGDGVGAVVLKALDQALKDHDHIYAAIIGSGTNQDGATNGITAPSGRAQEELERNVYENFSIDPATIQMVEAHGTGTKLGDPIEVKALVKAFRNFTSEKNYCAIGSLKTNIGHTQHAAGIAGIIKILLSLKNEKIPASLHYETCNPDINMKDSPFYVNTRLKPWNKGQTPRRAAVSSFGFSGTNAHMVIEEVFSQPVQHAKKREYLAVISAQSEQQLRASVQNIINQCGEEEIDCGNLSYTLLLGRRHLKYKLACVISDSGQFVNYLKEWLLGKEDSVIYNHGKLMKGVLKEDIEEGNQRIDGCLHHKYEDYNDMRDIAKLYCQGYDLKYNKLFLDDEYSRISLPVYPFLKERYWIAADEDKVIHPFVQQFDKKDEISQFYTSFSGDEFVLKNHFVNGNHILPGSAYLEMFYAGGVYLDNTSINRVKLKNITFLQPVTVENGDREILMDFIPKGHHDAKISIHSIDNHKIFCEGSMEVFAEGTVKLAEPLNRAGFQKAEYDKKVFYGQLDKMGVSYGACYQCIEEVYKKDHAVLLKIVLPEVIHKSFGEFHLHPCMLDSVFQSLILAISQNTQINQVSPAILFSVGEIDIVGAMTTEIWAVTAEAKEQKNSSVHKFDIRLYDDLGRNFITMRKVSAKTMPQSEKSVGTEKNYLINLIPRWSVKEPEFLKESEDGKGTVLLAGGNQQLYEQIEKEYGSVRRLTAEDAHPGDYGEEQIGRYRDVTDIIWIEMNANDKSAIKRILLSIQTLLQYGYREKALNWTILTINAQSVSPAVKVNPYLAALHGFAGSMAKECRNWNIRLLDFESAGILSEKWNEIKRMPFDKRGNAYVFRKGNWFVQEMTPAVLPQRKEAGFKNKGIYLIVGGAGGLGYGITSLLIRQYDATVIWLGRSKINDRIEKKIGTFETTNQPVYYSVDAAGEDIDLRKIVADIKKTYGRINGVIHAAQVFYAGSIEEAEYEAYEKSLASKMDVAVNLGTVFAQEKLDFMLFFSSINSYVKAPEQSAYSASCVFLDAFAGLLSQQVNYEVKVINWGYYKNNIEQASYLEKLGFALMDENDLLNQMNVLLNESFMQMSSVKINSENAIRGLNVSRLEGIQCEKKNAVILNSSGVQQPDFSADEMQVHETINEGFEKMLLNLTYQTLFAGLDFKDGMTSEQFIGSNDISGFYKMWMKETMRFFVQKGYLVKQQGRYYRRPDESAVKSDILWQDWEETKQKRWINSPEYMAKADLAEPLAENLLAIIKGRMPAMKIMFPDSSVSLMERVYKTNKPGQYFNQLLSCYLIDLIKCMIRENPAQKIRILEIGAGTGGTSEVVFRALKDVAENITEYCYTDVSQAFLRHANKHYQEENPYLVCRILNIENDPQMQEFEQGAYDFVIASNCLHATKDICKSIRNAKILLKENGILLLNEMCGNDFFSHMTFGMLEGWWLYQDAYLRMEGCPGIDKSTWQNILETEGFLNVCFPYLQNYAAMQEIIISRSNGIIYRIKAEKDKKTAEKKEIKVPAGAAPGADWQGQGANSQEELLDKIALDLKQEIAKELRIDAKKIEDDRELSDYGVDSIISVSLISQFNGILGLELESTILFEFTTLAELTQYIAENFAGQLMDKYTITLKEEASGDTAAEITVDHTNEMISKPPVISDDFYSSRDERTAIIGMSAKFPMADNIDEFWQNIETGKKCFHELAVRAELSAASNGPQVQSKYAGLISHIDEFHPWDYGLSETEAVLYSPEFRLLLMYVNKALEDAGITSKTIKNEKIGLFISANPSDYKTDQSSQTKMYANMSGSLMANQISYILNLRGPSECCETGCSSAVVAVHRARQALLNEECSIAIVAAVNLLLSKEGFGNMEELGLLCADGILKPFQAHAHGFVRSEGVGAIVLKMLAAAQETHSNVYSTIAGSAVAHGGRSASFATPGLSGMKDAIVNAYRKANISFKEIDYIEAHGISNSISDSIELGAIKSAYKEFQNQEYNWNGIAISCLKPNIGHGEIFSGLAAIIKVVMAMKNRIRPGITDFTELADNLSLKDTPFFIADKSSEWGTSDGRSRRASVNSYGLGGVNAHLVLEEYRQAQEISDCERSRLFVLSAKDKNDLYKIVKNLHMHLKVHTCNMKDTAYTLKAGRNLLKERLAVIAANQKQLIERLELYLDRKEGNDEFLFTGNLEEKETILNKFLSEDMKKALLSELQEREDLKRLAVYWTNIDNISWEKTAGDEAAKIVSLPPYPYSCKKYWYSLEEAADQADICPQNADISAALINLIGDYVGLKNAEFDTDKSLLDYGVDSIRIIPLLQKIQKQFSLKVTLKDILPNVPVKRLVLKLAEYLKENGKLQHPILQLGCDYNELVKLNGVENGTPVFWIHAALGGVEPYTRIADEIDRPFWGIQAKGWLSGQEPIKGINEMAAYYTQIIQSIQPAGPYDIGGFCLGGILAYEVTRFLQGRGQRVNTLVMIDSPDNTFQREMIKVPQGMDAKGIIFQTINMLLYSQLKNSPADDFFISYPELDLNVSDEAFISQVSRLAISHGLLMNEPEIAGLLKNNTAVQSSYYLHEYQIKPLHRKDDVKCFYFRNTNGVFEGSLRKYLCLPGNQFNFDQQVYWEDWQREVDDIQMIDVQAASHMTLLNEPGSLQVIQNKCKKIYQ